MTVLERTVRPSRIRMLLPCAAVFVLLASVVAAANIIDVPADYPTIQEAINAASDGDEVVVAPGTYNEAINFSGKSITVRSAEGADVTIIDADGLETSVVTFSSSEGSSTVLEGFTITGGIGTQVGPNRFGGGIFGQFSSPTIANCIIRGNTASRGGAMAHMDFSSPLVVNTLIVENTAQFGGAGTSHFVDSNPSYINCTFAGNESSFGSAVEINTFCHPALHNCVVWGNEGSPFSGFPHVSNSIVEGGFGGTNVIDADPLFADPDIGDFRLTADSPAIDAGDNSLLPAGIDTDLAGNPRVVDGNEDGQPIVDMGAFEFQPDDGVLGDLDGNGVVDVFDLLILLSEWGECPDPDDCPADLDGNGVVDVFDLLILLANWG